MKFREQLAWFEDQRRRAQGIADACESALVALRAVAGADDDQATKAPLKRLGPRRIKPATKVAGAGNQSKSGRYADAIVKVLERQDLHCADGSVLRREVAKVCGGAADMFSRDVSNALSQLKAAGRVVRKGSMWTLKEAA